MVSQQKIRERSEEISDVLLSAIFAKQTDSVLDDVAQKNNLSQDQRDGIERLVQYVLLGFLPARGLYDEVKKIVQSADRVVLPIYQEIDAKLFEPIRKDIEDNYLKFKVGAVDEASVQKPDVVSQINLKTPQPEGTVNLKKEDAGPKILAVGEPRAAGAYSAPAPQPLIRQEAKAAFGPSIIQKKQDINAAARPVSAPLPPPTDKDIFSLSNKDRWGIESENIVASRRIMGQPQVPLAAPVASKQPVPPPPAASEKIVHPMALEKKENALPVIEDSRLPEIVPPPPSIARKPQQPEEKKIGAPLSAARLQQVVPPAPISSPPVFSPERQGEAGINQGAVRPAPVINPTVSVNTQAVPQSVFPQVQKNSAPQRPVPPAPAFGGAVSDQSAAAMPAQNSDQPVLQPRPMQWAAPAQPPRQPDVVVEIRQTQESRDASASGAQYQKPAENESVPVRPMKVSSPVQSTPPVAPVGKEATLAMHPISSSSRQPEIKKPLDPNEVVDIGPVIIHKRDDPSVAQMRSGAQYKDLSSSGFSRNFSEQSPHPHAAPSVADVQVPVAPTGGVQPVGISVEKNDQSPAAGYGKSAPVPPAPKKGFFSFFRKH